MNKHSLVVLSDIECLSMPPPPPLPLKLLCRSDPENQNNCLILIGDKEVSNMCITMERAYHNCVHVACNRTKIEGHTDCITCSLRMLMEAHRVYS